MIGEWINTFDDIEKNIALIKDKEHIISINASNTEFAKDKRQQVLDDIKYINTLLEQNKQKIAALNSQLISRAEQSRFCRIRLLIWKHL
ncbi:MAG: hypothetical protein IPJ37_08690 [Bacteroidales bacterium]|nr:hypothetical protein [Bacteroidales bacterium]